MKEVAGIFEGLPRHHFGCIVADPPWSFKGYTAIQSQNPQSTRAVERHYECMSIEAIKAMPIGSLLLPDSHLWIWTTGPNLPNAFEVIKAWGFKYSAIGFVWVKLKRSYGLGQLRFLSSADLDRELHVGLGLTTRKNAEFCLLGRRGNARRIAKDIREIIMAPVREHSRKPDEAFARIERYCDGPRLDLFARETRPGWTSWGLEAAKFDKPVLEAAE